MMEVLKKRGVTFALVVVTRYFGGILLGAGGLVPRLFPGGVGSRGRGGRGLPQVHAAVFPDGALPAVGVW